MAAASSFRDWFCLNNRDTFTIDPKVNASDARLYFGRDPLRDRLRRQIQRAFVDPQVPKLMIYGSYGSGKTQTLFYLGNDILEKPPASCKGKPHIVHLDIEVSSRSTAENWHLQLTESVQKSVCQGWIQSLFGASANFDAEVAKLSADANIQQVFKLLRGTGDISFNSWRWLTGQGLSAKELQEIGVTRRLGDVGVGDLVSSLLAIGNLARAVGQCLIFCIDEMEGLLNVRQGDAAESWHDYLRKLAENSNSSVGFIIGFKADTLDDAPRILVRDDIISRIGKLNLIELEPLSSPPNVQNFIEQLLKHLVDQTKADALIKSKKLSSSLPTYPFSGSAFDLLSQYACADSVKSTPRNIIKTINECAIQAWDSDKRIIDDDVVNDIAPIIFA